MDIRSALKTQYHAALAMLKQAIDDCPDDLWIASDKGVAFYRVVYHTLFFTHFYAQSSVDAFRPCEHNRAGHPEDLGRPASSIDQPCTRAQLLAFWHFCDEMIDAAVDAMNLDAQECGFPWYKLPKLDHQINNIRHIQHHTATLSARLRAAAGVDVRWVGPNLGG